MRRSASFAITVLALAAVVGLGWSARGWLWERLLALHGRRPASAPPSLAAGGPPPTWPRTRPGESARRWVEAFSAGEDAMRDCLDREMAPGTLAQRSTDERLTSYRSLRRRLGRLELVSVARTSTEEVEAWLRASDGSLHDFLFSVQTEPPFKLLSVKILERHDS